MITKVKNKTTPSFREQAEVWLRNGQKRKRNPLRPETVKTYKSQIETNLNPNIGVLAEDSVEIKKLKNLWQSWPPKDYRPARFSLTSILSSRYEVLSLIQRVSKSIRINGTRNLWTCPL